jgi:hypothetical protein
MDKLIGRDLKDLGSVISSFMGGGKSEKAKKKTPTDEAPAVPASSVTPAAAESASPLTRPAPGDSPQPSATP